MGRNMFGPIRGEWDQDWRGWWGDEPPYHAPVFVPLLGAGERLFDGVADPGLHPIEVLNSPNATHIRYRVGG